MGKVTIRDVASAAGVSPATVSRALTQPGKVALETAIKVRKAADALGYQPRVEYDDAFDAALTGEIGALVPDLQYPIFADYVRGIQQECDARGFGLTINVTGNNAAGERASADRCLRRVDGLVIVASRMPDSAVRKTAQSKPVVVTNRLVRGVQSVVIDDRHSISEAIARLRRYGHRTIGYAAGLPSYWQNGLRWQALLTASQSEGIRLHRLDFPFTSDQSFYPAIVTRALELGITAIVAYNDLIAGIIIDDIRRRGRTVPGNMSVMGFDNIPLGQVADPHLATTAVDLAQVGRAAATKLIDRILHTSNGSIEPVVIASRFIDGPSIGPAPAPSAND
ncbi:LacI family DNA-binding transcriptional regulator [Bifidobacterium oedipodis]|uniref:LacI family transcriptional regulator n=1 Tax=Bifidobacterium oedipodis TaxID=2675322 RepID=A0A7Y0ENZ7_9BIFI|nr:LacI family DNA-binding transcriptional regulator [Bifidobacterium sp. DSM 109957]NMM93770.1 LacI family transcriptional regulator [Bifidobacterium sp. DSM 109957]